MEDLRELFYKNHFMTNKELYDKANEQELKYTHKDINDFMKSQNYTQVMKQDKRPDIFSSIVADGIRAEYQMDIIVYDKYAFHKYSYIFVVVDIYSRYALARAMTNRENPTIMLNMIDIFKHMGKPKQIGCDNEFNTNEFNEYCKENGIKVNYSIPNDIQKNSIVERLNRTIAGYIKRDRSIGIYNWAKNLDDYMGLYNHKIHRTTRTTPFNIFYKGALNKQDIIVVLDHFKVGDKVRLRTKRTIFTKADLNYFSKEIYTVKSVEPRKILLDNDKYYSARTLKKVDDIVYYEPPKLQHSAERKEYEAEKKQRDAEKIMVKEGLDRANIINTKRVVKRNRIFD